MCKLDFKCRSEIIPKCIQGLLSIRILVKLLHILYYSFYLLQFLFSLKCYCHVTIWHIFIFRYTDSRMWDKLMHRSQYSIQHHSPSHHNPSHHSHHNHRSVHDHHNVHDHRDHDRHDHDHVSALAATAVNDTTKRTTSKIASPFFIH